MSSLVQAEFVSVAASCVTGVPETLMAGADEPALGETLSESREGHIESFEETVRGYLRQELIQHEEAKRGAAQGIGHCYDDQPGSTVLPAIDAGARDHPGPVPGFLAGNPAWSRLR